jgi:hypothetical protein
MIRALLASCAGAALAIAIPPAAASSTFLCRENRIIVFPLRLFGRQAARLDNQDKGGLINGVRASTSGRDSSDR